MGRFLRYGTRILAFGSLYYCAAEYGGEFILCEGPSMLPTLAPRDFLFAEHWSVLLRNIQRGDVITCLDPCEPTKLLCKRVTAMEGDVYKNELIPRGHVWVEGDNLANSLDSREFGPLPCGLIRSRVVLKILPFRESGWLSSHWFNDRSTTSPITIDGISTIR